MNRVGWFILIVLLLFPPGCATQRHPKRPPLTGDPLIDGRNAIQYGPTRDQVLWQYRTALAAMRRQKFQEAKPLLDGALRRVEGVFGPDKSARAARGYFTAEAKKTFIGEPYERVMAYYYRGILYWMDGELDNARACFRSGQIHDSVTGEEQKYASDYVLLDYLDGLTTAKLGGDPSDAFKRAQDNPFKTALPATDPAKKVLFFVDYGPGPKKYATGQHHEQLRFRPVNSPVRSAQLRVNNQLIPLPPYDNLHYQATTRGGRVMDHILGNKAVFKSTTSAVGDAALISGAVLAQNRDHPEVGLGLVAAGLMSKIISAATIPEADVRTWDNLPLCLSFAALDLAAGEHTVSVEFLDDSNRVLQNLSKTFNLTIPDQPGDQVVYLSDQSTIPQSL